MESWIGYEYIYPIVAVTNQDIPNPGPGFSTSFPVCEISGRPIDNVYVKLSWSMSNIQNFVYNVQ